MHTVELADYENALLARLYDAEYGPLDGNLSFYLEQLAQRPGAVLELSCGTGRLSIALACRGWSVTGLDISQAMLGEARKKVESLRMVGPVTDIAWIGADMTDFELKRRFTNILIPFSGLGFLDGQARRKCLLACHRHLEPRGQLVIDLFNPGTTTPSGTAATETLAGTRQLSDPTTGQIFTKDTNIERTADCITIRYFYRADALCLQQTLRQYPVRPPQIEHELEEAGFVALESYGDYRANRLTPRSPRLLIIAQKTEL
ncbi:MAG: class I SAM-dependent methyltransferase [Gemmatimonadaceae bacterium]|nr:class I SAM-dependent methyltransferase [Gloeobacterales cyanobacterium ES-bin-141]